MNLVTIVIQQIGDARGINKILGRCIDGSDQRIKKQYRFEKGDKK